jgi:dihydrofolate reductase
MKTIYYTATSLDGFLADAQHSLEWLFQFPPPEGDDHYEEFIKTIGALAMGSSTYEWLLRHHIFPVGTHRPETEMLERPVPPEPLRLLVLSRGLMHPVIDHTVNLQSARQAGSNL